MNYDVLVIGGGPAGLSAALQLGRGCKKVLLCDAGPPRNAAAEEMHGFPTRDGTPPREFRRIGREQLAPYDVEVREVGVHHVEAQGRGFVVALADGSTVRCRRVILATGMVDEIPDVPGIREQWGRRIFQCPYCHGWELRGRPWGLLATSEQLLEFALFLTGWTEQVVAFTNGPLSIRDELRQRLERAGVALESRRIARLVAGPTDELAAVELEDGTRRGCEALVVRPPQRQSAFVARLGLALDDAGYVRIDEREETSVRGIYAAGDLTTPVQGALLAAAAGTRAAWAVNHALNVHRD
ncbi:NAD(P)/FAD-dependent oxidoreductase [Vulgatibacter sp.]|uniref:NAD(P)/FAD-dependent oxidoreductase n=1 Tax=Vulgatibacter sp. TaxID=1971226 RepID=UPI003566B625